MTDETARLNLPFILPAQTQKHVTYNEGMLRLDHLVQLSVKSRSISTPPSAPLESDSYIISANSTQAWAGHEGELALFNSGTWSFVEPQKGWRAWIADEQALFLLTEAEGWLALTTTSGDDREEVERLGINATADDTNRLSINADASLFNHAGTSHRLSLNKANVGETASVIFQSNFSARAEIGLTGDDALHMKVSADGNNFTDTMIMKTDGRVHFPNGLNADLLTGAVDQAGGTETVTGPPNLISIATRRRAFSLDSKRVYFSPFYVDRTTRYLGAKVAVSQASNTSGALMRVGLYRLGLPIDNGWSVGNRLADYGTQAVDVAGHKTFASEQGISLMPGWYLLAVGVNGEGVSVSGVELQTPGVLHFIPAGSGTSANFRLGGVARYLYDSVSEDMIVTGFPEAWTGNPVSGAVTTVFSQLMLAVPYWDRRSW
jgi:hypothetical protein